MSDMSRATRIASLCFVALIGALRPGPARAADWLDEMPAVPVVVQAVREQLEVDRLNPGAASHPAHGGDADSLASRIAGTLLLLRWFMEFESRSEWFMLPARRAERRARMEAIALDYMQVELAMGLGVEKHRGSIKTGCDRPDTYQNRKLYVGVECYRRTFKIMVDIYSSYAYRQSIFPRLFCKSGQAYHERFHKNFTGSGSNFIVTSAGVTRQLPGGQKPLGAALCKPYGGDANGNGLCDAWEMPLAGGLSGQASSAACGSQIQLVSVKTLDLRTVRVEFTRPSGTGAPPVEFLLVREDRDSGRRVSIPVVFERWEPARSQPAPAAMAPHPHADCPSAVAGVGSRRPEAVVLRTTGTALGANLERPWLSVTARSNGGVLDTARCRQAVPMPSYAEFKADLDAGLDKGALWGPYATADLAVVIAEPAARDYTAANVHFNVVDREVAAWVIRDARDMNYYVTSFVLGPHVLRLIGTASVGANEFLLSRDTTFSASCERAEEFQPVAYIHTHPDIGRHLDVNNRFSDDDWLAAFCARKEPSTPASFVGSYLLRPDRCIDMIDGTSPKRNDKLVRQVQACRPR